MDGLTWERDSRGSREQRVCLFLLWASRSTNITDHEHPCRTKHIHRHHPRLNHATFTGTTTKTVSQKRHLTVKWLKQLKAQHHHPPHIKTHYFAVYSGWYFWVVHVFEVYSVGVLEQQWVKSHPITWKNPCVQTQSAATTMRPVHPVHLNTSERRRGGSLWSKLFWF